ncbi:membrane protein [alpha proteobacterium U9-1i]|nr:membrane protein [alpha proteobacterium U9-1i]
MSGAKVTAQKLDFDELRARFFEAAPGLFAGAAFIAGAFTLIAVATPALPHASGLDAVERFVEELPELTASIGGVVLMALATGLARRVDAAWAATTTLLGATCLYALFRHGDIGAAFAAGASAVLLALSRRAFYRHSRLVDFAPDPRVALAIAAALGVAMMGAFLWAGARPGFADAPWWALLTNGHFGRPGRAVAVGVAVFVGLVVQRYLLTRRVGAPAIAGDSDLARAEALIAATPDALPDAQLAFTGDKSFLFAPGAFLMTAKSGASLIAMGGPVGARASWRGALGALRAEAERLSLRPVVYAATPDLLPDLLELGFRVEKVGENAIVDVRGFSLAGSARQKLRSARRKFVEREGAVFEVLAPPHDAALWGELRQISDVWLANHGGKEKSFSLGAFDPAYLARHHIAVVRQAGQIVAFANIWTNASGQRATLDLMRFHPDRVANGVMDFLFTEIILWAQASGFESFDLGMAPLAGLASDQYASLFARVGRLVRQYGESFYGFEGLRAFKDKFGPRWEPRYIAAPGAWNLPIVLAEAAMLTSAEPKPARRPQGEL